MKLIDMCVCGPNFIHECSGLHHMLQEAWTVNVRVTYKEIYIFVNSTVISFMPIMRKTQ